MTDRRQPQVRADDENGAKERIDKHVENDAKRWQYLVWAIVLAYVIMGVLSMGFLSLLNDAKDNTAAAQTAADRANHAAIIVSKTAVDAREAAHKSNLAICFEVVYLENVLKQTRNLIKLDPDPERRKTREQQLVLTKGLLSQLRGSVEGECPGGGIPMKTPKKP